jgi:glycosyltransferase involved in cell wall biosynthesis
LIQPLLSIIIAIKIARYLLAQVLDSIDAQSFDDYQIFDVDGRFSEKGLTIS